MAWMISLIFLPFFPIPLFLIFGNKKIELYDLSEEDLHKARKSIDANSANLHIFEFTSPLKKFLSNTEKTGFLQGHKVDLLLNGDETFQGMLREIRSAKKLYSATDLYQFREFS
jgi:hypothetical protein